MGVYCTPGILCLLHNVYHNFKNVRPLPNCVYSTRLSKYIIRPVEDIDINIISCGHKDITRIHMYVRCDEYLVTVSEALPCEFSPFGHSFSAVMDLQEP